MALSFRQADILEIAKKEGKVTVEELAERFDVTVQTIRRDLAELADTGTLDRVHGGAVLPSGVTNIGYEHRRSLHEAAKERIARRCAAQIPDGCSVFLNIGTSTEAVARELLEHHNLLVVTNNMNVANILAVSPDCEIMVAGGLLRRSDGGLIGNLTTQMIEQFKFDFAVIGCSALDEDGDLLDFDIQEVSVSKTIIRQARKTFLVADCSKFSRTAPARIASLRDIDTFFTDATVPGRLAGHCRDWGTKIDLAI
ncbi:DeoR/GlpR family DNA-binding transcription regulator [Qingshengfaniella alkalisoli]|uniref:DeoR/GlpR transcriptional regulator n=1 Tax=Qingshengfaniella alkalisoli TaxID=2599296 RepID=A0A5B8I5E2_9RHOB|nr:DeoR/GlpR family DNA-binding transcription regulator [Qingshengfaniella alkalisoli]QDY68485.1 DeoR/GlpR transcriptional regulator [Qingshengfaniella alkalisoli]